MAEQETVRTALVTCEHESLMSVLEITTVKEAFENAATFDEGGKYLEGLLSACKKHNLGMGDYVAICQNIGDDSETFFVPSETLRWAEPMVVLTEDQRTLIEDAVVNYVLDDEMMDGGRTEDRLIDGILSLPESCLNSAVEHAGEEFKRILRQHYK